ncbi:MAG: protease HtpX [Deltaproteobacteria bacterium HGW-Deltaproteobacteria-21]|nr:MAG: protease HtpX [Deltaproteobacteria bacterium HGW-Deltaproteobacteria-21]
MGNWFKTALLLGVLTALIVWVGNMFGGRQGMTIAFVLAIGMNFFSYWFSDKIVLRMYRASEVSQAESPELYDIVRTIAFKANMPMPRIYVIPENSPNAFATGRNPEHAVVAVTRGLLELMNRDEIMGVLAHEMAHVRNRDILIGSIAATMAGAIMILANMARWTAFFGGGSRDERGGGAIGMLVAAIVAPIAAMLIQMAVSRSREYHADETGADLAGHPLGLASALQKLGAYSKRIPMQAQANTAHMFIVNPLSAGSIANLFSTHPPLEERIARLMGGQTPPPEAGSGYDKPGHDEDKGRKQAQDAWRHLSR